MSKVVRFIGVCMILANPVWGQVPKVGVDSLLDIATWNIEWFGDTQNGPSDEALQFTNVKEVLNKTEMDLWCLCEVSSATTWQNLLNALPQYSSAIATYSQTQKTALLWRSSMFTKLSAQHVLTESQYDYDFAGRPPLEVELMTNDSLHRDTFFVYVLHLKAYADATSYGRRKNAIGYLNTFIAINRPWNKVLVMGDWNDKVVGSIYSGATESPFRSLVEDTINYRFASKQLHDQGKKSYVTGSMIDHILYSNDLDSFYLKGQAQVMDFLPTVISGYSSTTSDHYPVACRFNLKRYLTPPVDHTALGETMAERIVCYPNPVDQVLHLEHQLTQATVAVFDRTGMQVDVPATGNRIDCSGLPSGIYLLRLSHGDQQWLVRFVKQ